MSDFDVPILIVSRSRIEECRLEEGRRNGAWRGEVSSSRSVSMLSNDAECLHHYEQNVSVHEFDTTGVNAHEYICHLGCIVEVRRI